MGFLYPGAQYKGFIDNTSRSVLKDSEKDVYWNLFPVARGTLEGYATVYCYFDRTNMYGGYNTDEMSKYIDSYTYMKDMTNIPTYYNKSKSTNKDRLNDPNLKYNEVW